MRWSSQELEILRAAYAQPRIDLKRLAKALRRTHASVALKASRLGLGDFGRPQMRSIQLELGVGKFKDKEQLKQHTSARLKKWRAEHEHPRGMLGVKKSEASRAAQSTRVRAMWADPNHPLNSEAMKQRRSDAILAMRKAGKLGTSENTYSRCARGKREDLGDIFFRSAWEANYARVLEWRKGRGEIASWEYETATFCFEKIKRGTRSYTPDFKVKFFDGTHEWHEVKGWMDAKSMTRIKRMAKYYPGEKLLVIGADWFKSAAKTLAFIIPGWERPARRKAS